MIELLLHILRHHRCSICCQWRPIWMRGDHSKCMEGWLVKTAREELDRSREQRKWTT